MGGDEFLDAVDGVVARVVVEAFVELLVEDEVGTGGLSEGGVVGVGEGEGVVGLGDLDEALEVLVVTAEEGDHDLVVALQLVEGGGVRDLSGGWAGLLLDPVNDLGSGSASVEIDWLALDEPLEGWVALDLVLVGEFLVLGSVNFGEWDSRVGGLEDLGSGSIFRGKLLAVTTPWGIELDKKVFELLDSLFEVMVLQNDDILFFRVSVGGVSECRTGKQDAQDEGSDLHLIYIRTDISRYSSTCHFN